MYQSYFKPSVAKTAANAAEINAVSAAEVPASSLADQTFAYSLFKNEKDNIPQQFKRTWTRFVEAMQRHNPRKTKEGGEVFSPVTYLDNTKRGNAGVISITMAILDVDSGEQHEAVKARLNGLAYLIHSTWSHTTDSPSYRVIVPVTSPVAKEDWPQVWAKLNHFLGDINDPATKDPARIYYMPSHPVDRDDFFVEVGEGQFLDPNTLPEIPIDATPKATSQTTAISTASSVSNQPSHGQLLGTVEQLEEVQKRCAFVQWASEPANQPKVREPKWMALITNFNCFEGGYAAIHEASCHHPEYDEGKTDAKIERHKGKTGPITCVRIRSLGFNGCPEGGCKTISGKVTKAPAGLGSWGIQKQGSSKNGKLSNRDHVANIVAMFGGHLHYINSEPYAYYEGHWPRVNEKVAIAQLIAHYLGDDVSKAKVAELLNLVQIFQAISEKSAAPDLNLICVKNGTLDTRTGELLEHSPDHHLRGQLNSDWNPDAKCDRWLEFLDQIFVNDPDKAEKIQFLQEWFGYCLTPDISHQKFLWLFGEGGNGKSVVLGLLTCLVGILNISNAHIERLGDKYVRAELEGKLVNISGEMSSDATVSDGYLKSIVSGDMIEAERKFKDSFSFQPYVKLIASTNKLPNLRDLSQGFARRAILVRFNRIFTDANREEKLLETLIATELPGILAWSVEGHNNLCARGKFITPSSSIELLNQYRKESDPDRLYVDECLIIDPNCKGMKSNDIYSGYVAWCKASGYRAKAKVNFGKRLAEFGIESKRSAAGTRWLVKPNPEMETMWYEAASTWGYPILTNNDRNAINAPSQPEIAKAFETAEGYKL